MWVLVGADLSPARGSVPRSPSGTLQSQPHHPPAVSSSAAGLPSLIANLDFPAIPHSGIRGNKITDLFTLFVQLMC